MSRTRVQDAKMEGELLALTYGAIVARIMKDTERCEEANNQVKWSFIDREHFLRVFGYLEILRFGISESPYGRRAQTLSALD